MGVQRGFPSPNLIPAQPLNKTTKSPLQVLAETAPETDAETTLKPTLKPQAETRGVKPALKPEIATPH